MGESGEDMDGNLGGDVSAELGADVRAEIAGDTAGDLGADGRSARAFSTGSHNSTSSAAFPKR